MQSLGNNVGSLFLPIQVINATFSFYILLFSFFNLVGNLIYGPLDSLDIIYDMVSFDNSI